MGNDLAGGFSQPPNRYLREIRKKTNRHYRDLATSKKQKGSVIEKKSKQGDTMAELTEDSVKEYVISNPAFLDDLIIKHISQDRVRAWLKESKEINIEKTATEEGTRKESRDSDFAAELTERSFRHRQVLMITRSRFLFPFRLKRDELNELIERPHLKKMQEVESHLFPYTEIPTEEINKVFIYMTTNLLGKHAFPMAELCYFLSTVKSNYFNVEYHNYSHALSHAQSMYWILKKNPGSFTELEMKCLMIASIAHDVGHPGVNESYIRAVGNGLDKLYHSPILEHHHTQMAFLILQDINCNVFCDLEGDHYKQVLSEIQHAILSTSLNRYKTQCETMRHLIATDLDMKKQEVRDATKSVLMMTCDLSASWKQWNEHKNTVWSLYKEFYNQGDKEMGFGIDSAPMMMRMNAEEIPKYQVSFLENVILPVFQIATKVFPNISEILETTTENLELWNTYL